MASWSAKMILQRIPWILKSADPESASICSQKNTGFPGKKKRSKGAMFLCYHHEPSSVPITILGNRRTSLISINSNAGIVKASSYSFFSQEASATPQIMEHFSLFHDIYRSVGSLWKSSSTGFSWIRKKMPECQWSRVLPSNNTICYQ